MKAENEALAALAAAGYPPAPLELVRLRPGRAAAFRAGGAFVKVHLGADAAARASAAHEGALRASLLHVSGAPIAPAPGPLTGAAFACGWLDADKLGDALGARFAPRRRAALLEAAGAALAALHRSAASPPLAFGGWPAEALTEALARAASPPWRGFATLAGRAAGALHAARAERLPAGPSHGDLHAENVLVLRAAAPAQAIRIVDFARHDARPHLADIALLLVSAASRTPRLPPRRRGALGLPAEDETAFFAGYGPPPAPPELMALHILRVALAQALLTADEGRAGAGAAGRRRRLLRLRALAESIPLA